MYLHEVTIETKEQAERAAHRLRGYQQVSITDVTEDVTYFIDVKSAFDLQFRTTKPLPWWKRALILRFVCRGYIGSMPPIFNLDAEYEDAFNAPITEEDQVQPRKQRSEEKTKNPYTESVKRGADLLDWKRPGWRDEINRARLNMADGYHSILGQLFGDDDTGLDALLFIDVNRYQGYGEWHESSHFITVLTYGFTIDMIAAEDDDAEWLALQEAWIAELDGKVTHKESGVPLQLEPGQESRI